MIVGLSLALAWPGAWSQMPPGERAGAQAPARTGPQRVDAVEVELVADRQSVRAGETVTLGLRMTHAPGWHTYWRHSGDSGLPTVVEPVGPRGSRFDPIQWPAPRRFWVGPLANYGYEGEVLLPFAVHLPTDLASEPTRFEAAAQWLVCREVCVPGEARLALTLPMADATAGPASASPQAPLFRAMALRTPSAGEGLAARFVVKGGAVSMLLDALPAGQAPARAEFFPYASGVIAAAAPQSFLKTAGGWRLDLALADGAQPAPALQGLLLLDDKPFEVTARQAQGSAPDGQAISVAERPAEPVVAGGGGLLAAIGLGSERTGERPQSSPGASSSSLPAGGSPDRAQPAVFDATASATSAASWGLSLVLAALGGLLLNLMPCVFPVIGLKVLGFAQGSPDSQAGRQSMRRGGLAFAGGVLVSFWLLGALMLALRAAGNSVGWGFQLQSPVFVAAMALLFVLIGLNFSGVYEFGLSLTRLAGAGGPNARHSTLASFGAGVLAVLVASPCTAPFMGSALGLTLTQPPVQALSVFTAIGVGMALPYALLGCFPAWLSRLPRPGRWMQTLREALAFPMYASAAWLAWVLAQQAGVDALLRLLLAAVMVAFGAWAWGRWASPPKVRLGRALGLALLGLAAAMALLAPIARDGQAAANGGAGQATAQGAVQRGAASSAELGWQPWSDERIADALSQGKTVFVDFTAAWCVTCQANKQLVLERAAVREAFKRAGVITLRADWTQRDPRIAAALARHGRNGVPMYLVYRPGHADALVLPELLTVDGVLAAIR